MAQFYQVFLFTTALLLSPWGSAAAQLPPATLFGGGQQICNYQYAIPNGGNCVTYGPALEQKLSAVQQDIDRIKLQYVSQNTLLQEELRKVRQQASVTDANVADVTKELKNLQSTVIALQTTVAKNGINNNNGGGGGGASPSTANAMLQQLVTTTRTQLTQDMLKLENKINTAFSTLQADRQRDAVQQSRVDTAFQAELRQQQQDLTSVFQKMQQLETRVNNLQLATPRPQQPATNPPVTAAPTTTTTVQTRPPTTAPHTPQPVTTIQGSTTPNPLLQQLQNSLKQLDGRVKSLENSYSVDIPDLQKNLKYLQELSKNETLQLSDVKLEVEQIYNHDLPAIRQKQTDNYNALTQLSATIRRDLNPLKARVLGIESNVTSLAGQITSLGTRELNMQVQQSKDEVKINDLSLEIRMLATKLRNFQNYAGITTPTPTTPSTTTFPVPTPRPNGGGQPPRRTTPPPFVVPTPRPHAG